MEEHLSSWFQLEEWKTGEFDSPLADMDQKEVMQHIKYNCVQCGTDLFDSTKRSAYARYLIRGNYCIKCVVRDAHTGQAFDRQKKEIEMLHKKAEQTNEKRKNFTGFSENALDTSGILF